MIRVNVATVCELVATADVLAVVTVEVVLATLIVEELAADVATIVVDVAREDPAAVPLLV